MSSSKEAFRLGGKVAVVTGGGSGIGRAITLRFAASGAAIHILDLDLSAAESTAKLVMAAGGQAWAHSCDVTNVNQVEETFRELGRGRLDILVNNAGVSHIGTLESTTEEDFDRVFRVNVKGFYNCMHSCIGYLKANGGGVILNMASIAGSSGISRSFLLFDEQGRGHRHDLFRGQRLFAAQDSLQLHFACPGAYAIRRRLSEEELSGA